MTTTTNDLTPRQKRAMSDARCAWKAMTHDQRVAFLAHAAESNPEVFPSREGALSDRPAPKSSQEAWIDVGGGLDARTWDDGSIVSQWPLTLTRAEREGGR